MRAMSAMVTRLPEVMRLTPLDRFSRSEAAERDSGRVY
jgi:hypothetical protein